MPMMGRMLDDAEWKALLEIDRRPVTEAERVEARRVHEVYLSMRARMTKP